MQAWEEELPKLKETYAENLKEDVAEKPLRKRQIINAEKKKRGACVDCKRAVTDQTIVAFDLDHRQEHEKIQCVSIMASQLAPDQRIIDEMKKCDLRCANCHLVVQINILIYCLLLLAQRVEARELVPRKTRLERFIRLEEELVLESSGLVGPEYLKGPTKAGRLFVWFHDVCVDGLDTVGTWIWDLANPKRDEILD